METLALLAFGFVVGLIWANCFDRATRDLRFRNLGFSEGWHSRDRELSPTFAVLPVGDTPPASPRNADPGNPAE